MRHRSVLFILALLSAGLTQALSAAPAQAAFVGKNGWVVFAAVGKGGAAQLWREGDKGLVNITGTKDTPSIRHHDNFSPAWSPENGAHVAFVSSARTKQGDGPGDIYIMSPFPGLTPTNFLTNLTKSPLADDRDPAWDFTGGHVVYSSASVVGGQDEAADIWKVTWTGRLPTDMTPNTVSDDVEPAWSPRTHVIAFASNRTESTGDQAGPTYGIWTMDSGDGEILGQLTDDGTDPNWKSDGTQIAFVRDGNIWVMNADGSNPVQLTHDQAPVFDTRPVWSPDGQFIAFQVGAHAVPVPGASLAVMDANGSHRKPLLKLKQFTGEAGPNWKPECSVQPHKEHGQEVIRGTKKADLICFEKYPTTIFAGGGDDSIYGGSGDNVIHGGPGDDIVLGGGGNDLILGEDGNDYLEGDAGTDQMDGGDGTDQCVGDSSDTFTNCEKIHQNAQQR